MRTTNSPFSCDVLEHMTSNGTITMEEVKSGHSLAEWRLGWLSNQSRPKHYFELGQENKRSFRNMLEETFSWESIQVKMKVKGSLLDWIVRGSVFKGFCMFAIFANTLYIGISSDHQVKQNYRRIEGHEEEQMGVEGDVTFAVWFSLELILRIASYKLEFFTGEEWKWNVFDVFLVLNSVAERIFQTANLSFLRILRVFRIVRMVRVVRSVKALKSLRTMVFALLNSFVCLMWSFVMIIMIMYIFGIIFDGAVAGYFERVDLNDSEQVENAQNQCLLWEPLRDHGVPVLLHHGWE